LALLLLEPVALIIRKRTKVSDERNALAVMHIEVDMDAAARGDRLRAQLAAEPNQLTDLLRDMQLGTPAELVAELRREVAAARDAHDQRNAHDLRRLLRAALTLAPNENSDGLDDDGDDPPAVPPPPPPPPPPPQQQQQQQQQQGLLEGLLRCPLSMDTMTDPVMLVESGHTFERSYITRWLESRASTLRTCPNTRIQLRTGTLMPNFVLRSQLSDMGLPLAPLPAARSPVPPPRERPPPVTPPVAPGLLPPARIASLLGATSDLNSEDLCFLIRNNGGIGGLVRLLSSRNSDARLQAAWALRCLASADDAQRMQIATPLALSGLTAIVWSAAWSGRCAQQAALALHNLAVCDALCERIATPGVLHGLAAMLGGADPGAAQQAAAALKNLALNDALCERIAATDGVLPGLATLLGGAGACAVLPSLLLLERLSNGSNGRRTAIAAHCSVAVLNALLGMDAEIVAVARRLLERRMQGR